MGKRSGTYPGEWPRLERGFLRDVVGGFARRRKALRNRGCRFAFGSAHDWFGVGGPAGPRVVELTVEPDHRAHLYVRDANAGRVLLRRENMRLVNAPRRIVAAYEASVDVRFYRASDEAYGTALDEIWSPLELRVLV